jgi:hypothetical protein
MREVTRSLGPSGSTPPLAPTSRGPRGRRRRRLPILLAAALVVLSGTAVAWALVASSGRDTVSVQCEIQGVSTIIPSATGDPGADCAAQWQRDTGNSAPPLVAYDNGVGGITVLPADQTPPSGWTRLGNGETQNLSMVQMQQWLDDYVSGLNSGCYDNATATQMTEQALPRFGMAGWTVQPAPPSDLTAQPAPPSASAAPLVVSGAQQCVDTGILDGTNRTVSLRALGGPVPPGFAEEKLAVKLRSIAQQCGSLDATATQVRSAATDLGLSEDAHQFELTEVRDDSARCTTISEDVGGTIFLILRGPSG